MDGTRNCQSLPFSSISDQYITRSNAHKDKDYEMKRFINKQTQIMVAYTTVMFPMHLLWLLKRGRWIVTTINQVTAKVVYWWAATNCRGQKKAGDYDTTDRFDIAIDLKLKRKTMGAQQSGNNLKLQISSRQPIIRARNVQALEIPN